MLPQLQPSSILFKLFMPNTAKRWDETLERREELNAQLLKQIEMDHSEFQLNLALPFEERVQLVMQIEPCMHHKKAHTIRALFTWKEKPIVENLIKIEKDRIKKEADEEWKKKMEEQEKQKRELYAKYDAEKEERKREGMEIYSMCLEEVEEQKLRKINRQERHQAEMLAAQERKRVEMRAAQERKREEMLVEKERNKVEQERKRKEILATHLGLSLSDFQLPFSSRLQMILDIENEIHICNKQTSDFHRGIGDAYQAHNKAIQKMQGASRYEDYKKYMADATEIQQSMQNLRGQLSTKQHQLLHLLFTSEEQVIVNDKLGEQRWKLSHLPSNRRDSVLHISF